jgi:hypothetical protein
MKGKRSVSARRKYILQQLDMGSHSAVHTYAVFFKGGKASLAEAQRQDGIVELASQIVQLDVGAVLATFYHDEYSSIRSHSCP